ncbi:uncharacterized protein PV07_02300 [Cladophialophora immunda]|uniref:Uncharacterized protein n=1 Tax=Cladophialophora immunda TaxID=569365 RepID=A0A0D2DIV6_9EURO|nr:uncharacterized protein PV07_02300 [Cladophialophora immunda]KIW35614.1 hypothetical protein PV07_02300 [Cladophialophora immunda]
MASPARRVLGDKDPNAPIQQQPSKVPNRVSQLASPVAPRSSTKRPLSPEQSLSSSPRTGQKRKIGEIHGGEPAQIQDTAATFFLSQTTELLSDTRSENEDNVQTSTTQSRSTLATTLTTFRASQEESSHIESEFHIHDEPSQQTLDKMHAVTFTQSTSQLVPPIRPNLAKEGSQVSLSMSSLIDFDTNRSSQEDEMQMIDEPEIVDGQEPKTEEDARKQMMLEKAETLRTRLQLALYKIQTNQITKPFARLQVPRTTSPPPQLPPPSSSPHSSSTVRQSSVPEMSAAQEARVAIARARATMGPRPTVKNLSSLPTPEIVPTAFSARWNHEVHAQPSNIPSSPPLSQADCTPEASGGANHHDSKPSTPLQLSSPAPSQCGEDVEGDADTRRDHLRIAGLTSSVIKGEAANSLLELVRGVRSGGVGMCGV